MRGDWLLRRLAPDCSRIELFTLPKKTDEDGLLHSMGWETANIHLGSQTMIAAVRDGLGRQKAGWLEVAAREMAAALTRDWKEWKTDFHSQHPVKAH